VNRFRSKLYAAAERSQDVLLEEARANVPVDTGELRSSIQRLPVVDDGETITADVVATAEHAAYVEYGTGLRGMSSSGAGPFIYDQGWLGMPAQPYMRPALDVARKRIKQEFRR
jgi:HK97 gp10 family phage protein